MGKNLVNKIGGIKDDEIVSCVCWFSYCLFFVIGRICRLGSFVWCVSIY